MRRERFRHRAGCTRRRHARDVFGEIETPSRSILVLDKMDIVTRAGVSETEEIH
jgi:hypothetical protein